MIFVKDNLPRRNSDLMEQIICQDIKSRFEKKQFIPKIDDDFNLLKYAFNLIMSKKFSENSFDDLEDIFRSVCSNDCLKTGFFYFIMIMCQLKFNLHNKNFQNIKEIIYQIKIDENQCCSDPNFNVDNENLIIDLFLIFSKANLANKLYCKSLNNLLCIEKRDVSMKLLSIRFTVGCINYFYLKNYAT